MAAPASGERGSGDRLRFLDAVRGFALLLMIANHTGRWWQDGTMGWPRYNLIYVTMAVGASSKPSAATTYKSADDRQLYSPVRATSSISLAVIA